MNFFIQIFKKENLGGMGAGKLIAKSKETKIQRFATTCLKDFLILLTLLFVSIFVLDTFEII